MNIGQLEHAVEVIHYSSFALAAKVRHTSPQALSKAVSELERELGISLFNRTGRSIMATPFALEFEKKARQILFDIEELKKMPALYHKSVSGKHAFKLGVSDSSYRGIHFGEGDFAPLKQRTGIRVRLFRSSSDSCASALRQSLIDAALLPGQINELGVHNSLICIVQISVIVDKDSGLGRAGTTSLEEISDYPIACPLDIRFIRPYIEAQFQSKGITPHFEFVEPRFDDFFSFIRNGGVVFAQANGSIPKGSTSVREVALRREDSLAIPLFLAYKASSTSESVAAVASFLQSKMEARSTEATQLAYSKRAVENEGGDL